ncbi:MULTISPECIES: hypothetical protein [unclassified Rhizobium]|uniref:hypothetical protein n=1 Tax=unclassified Rhizobium TaxID=2613769 RepID=UPI00115E795D|nr:MULTISPECIES: hypothetical protein [unclassified Rhizobium]TQX90249.1 hypothetical protein EQW76_11135 [Rhizobium sp. rho-13.1]TQY16199.1 hypothetical protein EQW74_10725 [Rhizobium sp. rho-1.1]
MSFQWRFSWNNGFIPRPNLITNGTFDTDFTGWTNVSTAPALVQWSAGRLNLNVTTGTARSDQTLSGLITGNTYQFDCDMTGISSSLYIGTTGPGSMDYYNSTISAGHKTVFFTATTSQVSVRFAQFAAGDSFYDNITLRQIIP